MCTGKNLVFPKFALRLAILKQKVEMILRQQIIFDHYELRSDYSDVFSLRTLIAIKSNPLQSSGQCMHHVFEH